MSQQAHTSDKLTDPATSLGEYYAALTDAAVNHPAGLLAIHYGLWGPDTKSSREALLRGNQTLVEGCDLRAGQTILDAGCGVGGMAIWLAQEYGVRAVGLTICEQHVAVATEQARQRGVGDLVEFHHGDFMRMPFPDACFDAVLNHESYCYVPDHLAYLRGVRRVLKPGGRWRVLDGFLPRKRLSRVEKSIHAEMQRGWRTEPLQSWRGVLKTLEQAGFTDIGNRHLDSEVAPYSAQLCNLWKAFGRVVTPPSRAWAYEGFRDAIYSFDEALAKGVLTYRLIFGSRPAD